MLLFLLLSFLFYADALLYNRYTIADISCGGAACVARKTDGTVVAWGDATSGGNAPSLTDTYSQATPAQLRSAMNDQNCRI